MAIQEGIRRSVIVFLAILVGCGSDDAPAGPAARTVKDCFRDIGGADGPDYDQFRPVVAEHCTGTDHQQIEGVERVVFLGDSVTAGTPPTATAQYFRNMVGEQLRAKFGDSIVIDDCSRYGARNDDFLEGADPEIPTCFPDAVDPRRTLTIFTMGGNDISAWAQDNLTVEAATIEADLSADLLEDAVTFLTDPVRFPNGSYVIFGNPYEFTDGTGDLHSCPLAIQVFPNTPNWIAGKLAIYRFQERYMQIAVEHQVDMIFMLEAFCGHGFHNDNPSSMCYRGPDTPQWFDLTCIHPNAAGHAAITEMFMNVVNQ